MTSATKILLNKTYQDIWHRGEKYAGKRAVILSALNEKSVEAYVKGTKNYAVSIKIISRKIKINCSCPYFTKNGSICKHIVAVAIIWDEKRGFARPTHIQIENATGPSYSSFNAKKLYNNPLNVDLEMLRILPEETALSGYVRKHSKLPEIPKNIIDEDIPLTKNEIKKCFSEFKRWSHRQAYDPYFCSGEMAASFCGMLRIIKNRVEFTNTLVVSEILLQTQNFNKILMTELIDSSLGVQEFTDAHLEDIYSHIKSLDINKNDIDELDKLLKVYEVNRREY